VIAERSTSVNRSFGVLRVLRVMRLLKRSRSSVYWARSRRDVLPGPGHKRGLKTSFSDAELTEQIRGVLGVTPFVGEGHRKVWARLRLKGVRTSKQRTLRLMRAAGLLAPGRAKRALGPRVHDGTITPALPNVMWGTDATGVWTEREGMVTVFAAIDHATAECVGSHAAKYASRFEALEPLRQGVKNIFGSFAQGSLRVSDFGTITAASTSAITSRARSAFSASSRARPSCARPRATAASNASSARSRSSSCGCGPFATQRTCAKPSPNGSRSTTRTG
jgi:hypothetical protein